MITGPTPSFTPITSDRRLGVALLVMAADNFSYESAKTLDSTPVSWFGGILTTAHRPTLALN